MAIPYRPVGRTAGIISTTEAALAVPSNAKEIILYCASLCRVGFGQTSTLTADVAEVQTLTAGDATGGTFTLALNGVATGTIAYNASAGTIQTALNAISTIGASGVACAGGAMGSNPVTITFNTPTFAGDQPLLVIDGSSLTGGASASTRVPTIAQTTQGVTRRGFHEAGSVVKYVLKSEPSVRDNYLFLTAVSAAGAFRATFVG